MKIIKTILLKLALILFVFSTVSYANNQDPVVKVRMKVNYAPFNFSKVDDKNGQK